MVEEQVLVRSLTQGRDTMAPQSVRDEKVLRITSVKGVVVVSFLKEVELNADAITAMRQRLFGLIEHRAKILINFSELSYMPASLAQVLIALHVRLKAQQGHLTFYGLNQQVSWFLSNADLRGVFHISRNEYEAFDALMLDFWTPSLN